MGMRTLIEINNDKLHVIKSDPESFVSHLKLTINNFEQARDVLRLLFGTKIIQVYHNSEEVRVKIGNEWI